MDKSTFLGVVRSMACLANAPLDWVAGYVEGVREHDPKLAALLDMKFSSQAAVNDYCKARLEGR